MKKGKNKTIVRKFVDQVSVFAVKSVFMFFVLFLGMNVLGHLLSFVLDGSGNLITGDATVAGNAVAVLGNCVDLTKSITWNGKINYKPENTKEGIIIPTYYINGEVTLCKKEYKLGVIRIEEHNTLLNCNGAIIIPPKDGDANLYNHGIHLLKEGIPAVSVNNVKIKNCLVPEGDIILENANLGKVNNNIVKFLHVYSTKNTEIKQNKISEGKVYLIESNRVTFSNNLIERTTYQKTYGDLLDTFLLKESTVSNNLIKVPDEKPMESVDNNFYRGIVISAGNNNLFKNNELQGFFGDGISLSTSSYKNNIISNTIKNNGVTGISLGKLESSGDNSKLTQVKNIIEGNIICNSEGLDIDGSGKIKDQVVVRENTCDKTNVVDACSKSCA